MGGLAAFFIALQPVAAIAQTGNVRLELIDRRIDENVWPAGQWVLTDGALHLNLYNGAYTTDHTWSDPPLSMDKDGFFMTLNVAGQIVCGPLSAGTSVSSSDFAFENDVRGTQILLQSDGQSPNCPPATGSNSATIHVLPGDNLGLGEELELYAGASYGPGVKYIYRVVDDGSGAIDDPDGKEKSFAIKVEVDCPTTITIGALPGLQCAFDISGYNRNSSKDVVVTVPSAVDGYDNTASGIQLTLISGAASPNNWEDHYRWVFNPFACAKDSPGVGANCYDNFAVPGPVTIPVIISQEGAGSVTIDLVFNVIGDGSTVSGVSGAFQFRLGSRARAGTFIHIETGPALAGQILLDWLSAEWVIEPVANTTPQQVRIRSVWKPDLFFNVEHGALEASPVEHDWLSANWLMEGPTADTFGTVFYRIRNVWKNELYLDLDANGRLIAALGEPGKTSQDFWLLY